MKCLLLPLCLLLAVAQPLAAQKHRHLETVYQWKLLEYGFPTAADREQAVANGNLVPSNGVPIDVAPHHGLPIAPRESGGRRYGAQASQPAIPDAGQARVFVTIPRFQTGIPYTLATVSDRSAANGPLLQAYPAYSWHNSHGSNCDGITSAFRVAITECNQMWVIDSGVIGSTQHCPPQLLLFDLLTDQLVHRYRFDSSLYTSGASLFITPIADVRDPPPRGLCQHTMVYVADVTQHGLVVYDFHAKAAWRVENRFMYPDPNYGTHTIAGETFYLMDGMFGLSTDKRKLYFHPLASVTEYAVALSVLDNRTTWEGNLEARPNEFRSLGERSSECAAQAIDSRGNIFCVTFNPIKLISWNVNTPYRPRNLREVPADPRALEFVSGMKVLKNRVGKEELWMISNRFQKISAGTQNPNEVNFRIIRRPIDDVQNGIDFHNTLIFS